MATATFTIPDFHRIDNAHAGRTTLVSCFAQLILNLLYLRHKFVILRLECGVFLLRPFNLFGGGIH